MTDPTADPPSRVTGLFATPLMHAPNAVGRPTADALTRRFVGAADQANHLSDRLSHTAILDPRDDPLLAPLVERLLPRLADFGELLFGQRLDWLIKEMWFNVLSPGGHQTMHNHANSFVSGVVYLTTVHASASTVFVRGLGHAGYVFSNTHAGTATGPFNGDKWVMPEVASGDLVLFPSHLLHEVPVNAGPLRVTLAFNAIPQRLNAWGYSIGFTA